jgi:transcriptional regulator with XRE-family HTH domain
MPVHPLRRFRELRGLSLRSLAAATKIHFVRLHYFERGLAPSEMEIQRLSRVLAVPVEELRPEGDAHV